jgi:hypothetical protein
MERDCNSKMTTKLKMPTNVQLHIWTTMILAQGDEAIGDGTKKEIMRAR